MGYLGEEKCNEVWHRLYICQGSAHYICQPNPAWRLFCKWGFVETQPHLFFVLSLLLHIVMAELKSCNKAYDLKSLKYYYLALCRKKCADPWCWQQCRRHVLSVQTHVQNLIFWQRDMTKTNTGQSSKLLKQLRIVAWVSSGRNSGYIPFLKKIVHLQDLFCIIETLHHLTNISPFLPPTAAAAKSHQSCPTLCDPIDGSPPGPAVPGILQARILEWVAIAFFTPSH